MVAERLPAMCGRATLATEESSTTMKVASMTETATIHGLTLGTQLPCASSRRSAAIGLCRSGSDSRNAENPGRTGRSACAGGCRIQEEAQSKTIVARKGWNPQQGRGRQIATAARLKLLLDRLLAGRWRGGGTLDRPDRKSTR